MIFVFSTRSIYRTLNLQCTPYTYVHTSMLSSTVNMMVLFMGPSKADLMAMTVSLCLRPCSDVLSTCNSCCPTFRPGTAVLAAHPSGYTNITTSNHDQYNVHIYMCVYVVNVIAYGKGLEIMLLNAYIQHSAVHMVIPIENFITCIRIFITMTY